MGRLVLILGGMRSGKSRYAVEYAKNSDSVAFIATARAEDEEMKERIEEHKRNRPKEWKTYERHRNVASLLTRIAGERNTILIDCVGALIANMLFDDATDEDIVTEFQVMIDIVKESDTEVVVVSNEVGCCLVPTNELGRRFADILGTINQKLAEAADEVLFMLAGIPIRLKGQTGCVS